jgi:PilZ domain
VSSSRPRLHVRLHYEGATRPSLILEAGSLNVLDLSERGLRYRQESGPEPALGAKLEGILRLSSGETLPVRGTVVRVMRPARPEDPSVIEVAAHLTDVGIPSRVILAERKALQEPPAH